MRVTPLANVCDEMSSEAVLSDDIIKQMVTGNQMMGERKGKDPFFFTPTARIVVATNHLPKLRGSSHGHGLFRRIMILPFNRIFTPEEYEIGLIEKLEGELSGIFVWAVAGLKRLQTQGAFTLVPSCTKALEDYKTESNSVALFMSEVLEQTDKIPLTTTEKAPARTSAAEVYRIYREYCAANGYRAVANNLFGKHLIEQGVVNGKSGGYRYYLVKCINLEAAGINTPNPPLLVMHPTLESAFEDDARAE